MILLFAHGWGFDASFWSKLAGLLPQWRCVLADRGYFGAPAPLLQNGVLLDGPVVAITHSFGTMQVLANPPRDCRGLVAINGFDCFTAREGVAGVAPRVVSRMLARFDHDPAAVLADFRQRCGCDAPFGTPELAALRRDLQALADDDCRAETARWRPPILSLQAEQDQILPATLREQALASARQTRRQSHPTAGHLLPIEDPEYCARHIAAFLGRLT